MSVVLGEGTNTCQAVKLATLLVAEHSTELCDAQRQILVRTRLACEHLAVVRTVHRLEHILLVLLRCVDRLESVLAVVSVVARCYVKALSADTRSDNLLIVVRLKHLAEHLLQAQTQLCTLSKPDRQTLTYTVREHEEFHLLTNLAMVALLSLLKHEEILVEHRLLRERDTVDTCHLVALCIATPESTCYACNLHSLDSTCVHQVRTTAKVGEVALCVCRNCAILEVFLDMLALVLLTISLELCKSLSL